MRFSYHTEQWLPYRVDQVFDFFANPNNLPLLMPEWQGARIDAVSIVAPLPCAPPRSAGVAPANLTAAGLGSRLTLSFLPFPHAPFRVRWEAVISEFVWDEHFCDRQLRGPFAYWNHCHSVRTMIREGVEGTIIADALEYEVPFGLAGRVANSLLLRHQIHQTFAYRHEQLLRILPTSMELSRQQASV